MVHRPPQPTDVQMRAASLVEVLQARADGQGHRTAFRFLGGTREDSLTFAALDREAASIAAHLMEHCQPGDRVILLFPPSLAYVSAFMGCLYAGLVAVPLYPPRPNQKLYRAGKVITDSGARVALTNRESLPTIEAFLNASPQFFPITLLASDALATRTDTTLPGLTPNQLAFLQYTSGSTGSPKGVMVSHGNIMANAQTMMTAGKVTREDVFVSWLPMYHDMGLIGMVLEAIYGGFSTVLMPSSDFVRDPISWLEAITRFKATISGGPNFGYELCCDRISPQRLAGLDLSTWRLAFNGAEPVRAETLDRFAAAFAQAGFRRRAFFPCYGMAETTLFITGKHGEQAPTVRRFDQESLRENLAKPLTQDLPGGMALVGCGQTCLEDRVRIVDDRGNTLEAGQVGEIWVASTGKAQGYWQQEQATKQVFQARLANGDGPYLRTGDLGFLDDGELFITGRLKDLLIFSGRNYYPQDLERAAERSHSALQPNASAAFSIDERGREQLILVAEVKRSHVRGLNADAVIAAIRADLETHFELAVHEVVLLKPGRSSKTSSGKIQRRATRTNYLEGTLVALSRSGAGRDAEADLPERSTILRHADREGAMGQAIRQLVATTLAIEPASIEATQPLTQLGMSSMAAIDIQHKLERAWGIQLPLSVFLTGDSIAKVTATCLDALQHSSLTDPEPNPVSEAFPLSPNQMTLWHFQQMSPSSPAYNLAHAVRFRTGLDLDAFKAALSVLLDRHPLLRGHVENGGDHPQFRVRAHLDLPLTEFDAKHWQEADIQNHLTASARQPFDVTQGPLIRFDLLHCGQNDFVLLLNLAHIVGDMWSLLVFLDELHSLYSARGSEVFLEAPKQHYGQYARKTRAFESSEAGQAALSFWRSQLEGELPYLDLPCDRERPLRQSNRGATLSFSLSPHLSNQLSILARDTGSTKASLFLAAFRILLHRFANQERVLIGMPFHGRTTAATGQVIGYFINPVVFVSDFEGDTSFQRFLSQTQSQVTGMLAHAQLPFQSLLAHLDHQRDPARSPLFQAMFAYQEPHQIQGAGALALGLPGHKLIVGELEMETMAVDLGTAQFELTLFVAEEGGRSHVKFEYNADLFHQSTIAHLAEHWQALLETSVLEPRAKVAHISPISAGDRQILARFSQSRAATPFEKPVALQVLETAARHPHAPAVLEGGQATSYATLVASAKSLAAALKDAGIAPETRVGLCFPRSSQLVTAALAVQLAGGAYIPLDPNYPDQRLHHMVADSGMTLLLTSAADVDRFSDCLVPVWPLDSMQTDQAADVPPGIIHPDQTAYLIYTSGSTGVPKGVAVPHRGLAHLVAWHAEAFGLTHSDHTGLTASPGFDASVWEIWPSLCVGAALHVLPENLNTDPAGLHRWLQEEGITATFLATPLAEAVLPLDWSNHRQLRILLTGGDKLHRHHAGALPFTLVNNYGPTENTVVATSFEVDDGPGDPAIGKAIQGVRVHVLNRWLMPVPLGVAGELCLAGPNLARGYRNRPATTAGAFVPNPFADSPGGSRLYKTGDLVRFDRDGNLHFLGRTDQQIKLRGFRIELGEIESALRALDGVREALVRLETTHSERRLIAYLTGTPVPAHELRANLSKGLPVYMVPTAFLTLDRIPLTAHGKVDIAALPSPQRHHLAVEQIAAAPRNASESALVAVWREVLNLPDVGIHDNFLELGGDSILAIQIVSKARASGLHFSASDLFNHPTVAGLAKASQTQRREIAGTQPPAGPIAPTPIQQWFLESRTPEPHHFNQSVLLEVAKGLEGDHLEQALHALHRHHDSLRLRFDLAGMEPIHYAEAGTPGFQVFRLSPSSTGNDEVLAITGQLQRSLNLKTGPLMACALFRTPGSSPDLVFLTVHHLVVDGMSWRILLDDLTTALKALDAGEPINFPDKTTSLGTWSRHLQATKADQDYWSNWADTVQPATLPGPEASQPSATPSRTLSLRLEPSLWRILNQAPSRIYRLGVAEVLLAALARSLANTSGRWDMTLDLESHGRETAAWPEIDLSRTVGWFTALYPVRLTLSPGGTEADDLLAVKAQLAAVPQHGAFFDPTRTKTPPNQVVFNYLGQFDSSLREPLVGRSHLATGPDRSPEAGPRHGLEINAMAVEERLEIQWRFHANRIDGAAVEALANDFETQLQRLAAHCARQTARRLTPGDFAQVMLSQEELDKLTRDFGDIEAIFPLTPVQEGMLFHGIFGEKQSAYFEQLVCRFEGDLDEALFKQAWLDQVAKTPALASVFQWESLASPIQTVLAGAVPEWSSFDLQGSDSATADAEIQAYLEADRQRGFQLDRVPLTRFAMFRTGPDRWHFVWSYHHLLLDGWSMAMVLEEVLHQYRAAVQGQAFDRRKRPSLGQIAETRRQAQSGEALEYWRDAMAGFSAPLTLPFQNKGAGYRVAHLDFDLPQSVYADLKRLTKTHGLTLSTCVQGAWALLLSRYCRTEDVVFGLTVSGRDSGTAVMTDMIGLLINTIPARIRLTPGTTTGAWLEAIQRQALEREPFSNTSLGKIQSVSELGSGQELFDSLLVVENYPLDADRLQRGLEFRVTATQAAAYTHYALTLVARTQDRLTFQIAYDAAKLPAAAIQRMAGHLEAVLTALPGALGQPLHRIPMLTESEEASLIEAGRVRQPQPLSNLGIHQWFERQALAHPNRNALTLPAHQTLDGRQIAAQRMTYEALNRAANQLAQALRARAIGTESLVGLCVNRSLDMVIGILGILKAGAAYVPLDPAYPKDRLAYITADADLAWVICQPETQDTLPTGNHRTLTIEAARQEPGEQGPLPAISPQQTAYVIYTSGSTGKPKGVPVSHGNITRLFETSQALFDFDQNDCWSLFHSYAFDFTVWELWGALIHGGRLVIVPQLATRDAAAFHQLLAEQKVTVLNQTPSAFVRLIEADEAASTSLDHLRHVIFGGEALEPRALQPWFETYGEDRPRLTNMYGITETTVHVTFAPISRRDCQFPGGPLGKPLPDLSMALLDDAMNPVPLGVAGEIFVGGAGVARGYLNRPSLTAQRFVPDPFSDRPGSRLYRSGDLGRYDEHRRPPAIEYAGRCDFQVKLRGYRIELGEIEATLTDLVGVRQAVVLPREDLPGIQGKQLVAYLAGKASLIGSTEQLHDWVAQHLPDYMVPNHFVVLDELPMTAHGKIDRNKLPLPATSRTEARQTLTPPGTDVEKQLVEIWAEVLERDTVGIHQRFFELGGDSILSIRLMTAAKKRGLSFSLPQLFQLQTVAKLSQVVVEETAEATNETLPFALLGERDLSLTGDHLEDAYPATSLQKGMLYHAGEEGGTYHNLSSFHVRAPYDETQLRQAIASTIARHPALRTAFDLSHFSEPMQLVYRAIATPVQFTDWRQLDSQTQALALKSFFDSEQNTYFDWSQPGMLRFHIHRRTETSFQFTLTEHHAILDGWSVASLLSEIFRDYFNRLGSDQAQPVPEPEAYFRDFVALERETVTNPASARFWADQLEAFEFTRIPRLQNRDQGAVHLDIPIDNRTSNLAIELANRWSVPLKSLLLAVHLRVLALVGGTRDVLTGLVANGRPENEGSERVLGLYLNTLPLRFQLSDQSWETLVRSVFEWERQALPHRRFPLADIQKMFGGKPLFETAFNYTHFHVYQAITNVAGLEVLDTTFSAPTHIAFAANFSRDLDNGAILLSLDYRSETIPNRQASDIGRYYRTALESLTAVPEGSCQRLSFLSGETRKQVLETWNRTEVIHPKVHGLHGLVTKQAAKTPNKTAICQVTPGQADVSMDYRELDVASNQLAHYLIELGATPDQPIAFCMSRGPEAIVTMVAILKAGCGYLPLDPGYPDDRLAFMIADSGAQRVCCFGIDTARLSAHAAIIDLERDRSAIRACPKTSPDVAIHPESMAYIIYTSGSTGTPKGVVISHRAILNQIHWRQASFPLTGEDRLLQNLSLSFDPSVWQVFWPLSLGGELVLIPNDAQRDIPWLAHLLLERRIAATAMVPSVLRVLLSQPDFLACDHLKHISCGGEGLPADLVTRFCEHFGETGILHVVYGPTEATIDASTWHASLPVPTRIAPIGLPIHNARLYVLDPCMEPVPPGVPGELFIGGTGLGRGYLNRPGLTAARYVPNPFEPNGERLYRSGDIVRYLDGGLLEFRGRVDHQVKVRGFRIELGEIEAILAQHPNLTEVVCIVREDVEKRLVAYITAKDDQDLNLRAWLSSRVPDYMIPAVFVRLDAFPRLPNDKIDRGQLPAPDTNNRGRNQPRVAPRNPTETTLAEIWSAVLGLDSVGVTENFFELGGDSILSLQIIARAREAGLPLSAKDLFEHQTIETLAKNVGRSVAVNAEQGPIHGQVALTPVQRWFFEAGAQPHFNQALLLRVPGRLDHAHLQKALNAVCGHHDALRLGFQCTEPDAMSQVHGPEHLEVPLEIVQSALEPKAWQTKISEVANRAHRNFDLAQPPLIRAVIFRNTSRDEERSQRLLLIAHHLVVDGVSWRFIAEDLQTAYLQLSQGKPLVLPPKTSSFKAWSSWLGTFANSEEVLAEKDYWLRQTTSNPLEPDHPNHQANTVANAATMALSLTAASTTRLLRDVPGAYQTQIDDILLTALTLAWQGWSARDLVLDLESHGRHSFDEGIDITRTVGWFTAAYPIRLAAGGNAGSALKTVKQTLRDVPHAGLGYGLLRYLSGKAGQALSAKPDPVISFNYLGQLDAGDGEGPFLLADEPTGQAHAPDMHRRYLLEINAFVKSGELHLQITWPPTLFERDRMEALKRALGNALETLIQHCTEPGVGGRTPSDFPLAHADQAIIDRLVGNGADIEDLYPLAPSQRDILFHVTLQSGSMFHQQLHFTIDEALDVQRFQAAWQQTVQRHAALRASFHRASPAMPLQCIHRHVTLPWEVIDWRALDEVDQKTALEAYLQRDRQNPFHLENPPLMRFGLFRLAESRYRFVWSHHHLLSDGWSLPLILGDVLAAYLDPSHAPATPNPFRNYLAWLDARDIEADRIWWRQGLQGFIEPTPLPLDRLVIPDPSEASHAQVQRTLDQTTTRALSEFAREHRLTVNTLVQGAWALVLNRYSRQGDVVFGTSVSGRPAELAGVETIVGLFINTLPVRVKMGPDQSVTDWLSALQQAQQQREARAGTPASTIREVSEVPGDLPLYESILVFENYPIDQALRKHAMPISELVVAEQTNFPLTLTVAMKAGELNVSLTYHTHRFNADLADRVLGHFVHLLDQLHRHHKSPLSDIDLNSAEASQALLDLGRRGVLPTGHHYIHRSFEDHAARSPQAVAAVAFDGDRPVRLEYGELDRRANALANRLLAMGIERETPVGIYLDKCLELPVSVLAVLKAGATFVPLDPDYPSDRLKDMAAQAGMGLILTRKALRPSLPVESVACLSLDETDLSGETSQPPGLSLHPDQAAYLIFSSGSTGRPKGISVSHRAIANAALAWENEYQLRATCKVHLQLAAFSFDVFAGDLARTFTSGGTLVLCPKRVLLEPAKLWSIMTEHAVDAVEFVPALLRSFCDYLETHGQRLDRLRLLAVGSDLWTLSEMARVKALCGPDTRLITSYGLTEAAVDSTYFESTGLQLPGERTVPIGRAFPNTAAYILDRRLKPEPVGVAGMLHIGGPGLARGYHRRPGLTAQAFIPNPYGPEGSRLYRTGDAARLLPDGNIDFLGRLDQQVKIRGFRIELGEIEAVLKAQEGVRQAVVLAREDAPGAIGPQLVAYWVGDASLDGETIRQRVRRQLPHYMVPAFTVQLAEMPLTPNGKVDRRNLPAPDWQRTSTGRTTPNNGTEALLAEVWGEVLQIETPDLEANFFDLGGHSLVATRLVSKIANATGKELPLRALFEHPTIAQLAVALEHQSIETSAVPLIKSDAPPVLSHGQERLWFVDQISSPSGAYNLGFALRLEGSLDADTLERAFQTILERHESLRSHFREEQGKPVVAIESPGSFHLKSLDLSGTPNAEADARAQFERDSAMPFDLANDPLLRVMLFRISDRDHLLSVVMHHIVSDAWSIGVMVRELSECYRAELEGRPPLLPPLPIQYSDFAHWQKRYLADGHLDRQLAWWKDHLDGAPPVLTLPFDRPRTPVRGTNGGSLPFELDADLTQAIHGLAKATNTTLFMNLLGAYAILLGRYSQSHDVVIGTPIANRTRAELEPLIGFFVNTLALRIQLGPDSWRDHLARIRDLTLEAFDHQDLPFERLVEGMNVGRELSHEPIFQVMFTLQNAFTDQLELPGLDVSATMPTTQTSRFDLLLVLEEIDGGLRGIWEYNADLFDRSTIARMSEHFHHLLTTLTQHPSLPIAQATLERPEQAKTAIAKFQAELAGNPKARTIQAMVEAQVARTPDFPALQSATTILSFEQLNQLANRLAHHLIGQGVGLEQTVGIAALRGPETIIGMLAILKAGGCYLPLDPNLPEDRLAFMLEEANVVAILCKSDLNPNFKPFQLPIFNLEKSQTWPNQVANPERSVPPQAAAYIMYTSGSTGMPKGTVIPQQAVVRLIEDPDYMVLDEDHGVLHCASPAFDAATFEIWAPLASGSRCCIFPAGPVDVAELAAFIHQNHADTMFLTAGLFNQMVTHGLEKLRGVTRMLVGGEAISKTHAAKYLEAVPNGDLCNIYGPTENTTFSTYKLLGPEDVTGSVPIGQSIRHSASVVLDESFQVAPTGVMGTLHVAGPGLARGYLNQPRLTAQVFLPNPYALEPGDRVYNTGDLAYRKADEDIAFCGRGDGQVKIRGFRIEIGEIEACLLRHEDIDAATVLVREDLPGGKGLAAFIQTSRDPAGQDELDAARLGQFIRKSLPDYMVPAAFMRVASLPLNRNGKVDRNRLLAMPISERVAGTAHVAPRNDIERQLAEIWKDVLELDRVGVNDNFFDIGGHSLLATQILSRMRENFPEQLSLQYLFEEPTIAGIANGIENIRKTTAVREDFDGEDRQEFEF